MNEVLATLSNMFTTGLLMAAPLIIAGIGGLFSERSGVVNIALEGCMLVGAFVSAVSLYYFEKAFTAADKICPAIHWVSFLLAGVAGALFASLLAVSAIHCKADQTISGTAMNMLSTGLTVFICSALFDGKKRTPTFLANYCFQPVDFPVLSKIPIVGDLFFKQKYPTIYVAYFVVIVAYYVVFKTPYGLRLRSCGEFPQASASVGISVPKMRWSAVLIAGFLSGLGGASILLPSSTEFSATIINGFGFIAVGTLIFGGWKPFGVLGAGILFGFIRGISDIHNGSAIFQKIDNFEYLAKCVPYLATIIIIVAFSGRVRAPKANGEIYDIGKR